MRRELKEADSFHVQLVMQALRKNSGRKGTTKSMKNVKLRYNSRKAWPGQGEVLSLSHPEQTLICSHYSSGHYLINSVVVSNPFVEELEKLIQHTPIPVNCSVNSQGSDCFSCRQAIDLKVGSNMEMEQKTITCYWGNCSQPSTLLFISLLNCKY